VARPLKVFQTHIGFHDLVVAAPSMKAAAEAWGSSPRIFAQGFAWVTQDSDAVSNALAHPGIVLRRPHGQAGQYKIEPDKPAAPRASAKTKQVVADAAKARARKAAEKRAKAAAEKRAKQEARDELAVINDEEGRLRERRRALQNKFHLRTA
jgi:colicin import membrane protein